MQPLFWGFSNSNAFQFLWEFMMKTLLLFAIFPLTFLAVLYGSHGCPWLSGLFVVVVVSKSFCLEVCDCFESTVNPVAAPATAIAASTSCHLMLISFVSRRQLNTSRIQRNLCIVVVAIHVATCNMAFSRVANKWIRVTAMQWIVDWTWRIISVYCPWNARN